jgi:hypothetical protein
LPKEKLLLKKNYQVNIFFDEINLSTNVEWIIEFASFLNLDK